MFVGHYSVAFAVKSDENRIPLWVLFVAVQFLDYIWATLVLLGIEKLRVIKGFTAGSMLDSYYHPYSHSLVAALIWSAVAAIVYKKFQSARRRLTKVCRFARGLCRLLSLDSRLIAHPRDLAIYPDKWKVGLGLWNYRGPEFGLEVALLAGGITLYLARNTISAARKKAVIGFGLALVIVQIGDTYVPRTPLSDRDCHGRLDFLHALCRCGLLAREDAAARNLNHNPCVLFILFPYHPVPADGRRSGRRGEI